MRPRSEKLNVLFEDNHLLVVNKPPLLPTMGVKEGELSLLSQSRQYIKKKYNKPGNVYLGIVSRPAMIEIAIGITVGISISALLVYPIRKKRRSGLFSF